MALNRVTTEWLFEHGTEDRIVIVDCRFDLAQPDAGRQAYEVDHIPGAIYLDLNQELSAPVGKHGGRHPLPDAEAFAAFLGKQGIGSEHSVVAYDDQGGAMASRLWWMLTYMGHKEVYVLDGGYRRWKEAGYPIVDEVTPRVETVFTVRLQPERLVQMNEVREKLGRRGTILIDSREYARYVGDVEPIDAKAGHIPGARSLFWKDNLDTNGQWLPVERLQERFASLQGAEELIVYCGSGVTACPNVLALEEAGFTNVRLYAGSWSDWISYEENPVATGAEEA